MTRSSRITSGDSARAWKTASRALPCLADRLDVRLGAEQKPKPAADDSVVVDDEDANAHGSGTSATIVVPERSLDSISRRPSRSASRSRIPSNPTPPSRVVVVSKPDPSSSITAATAVSRRATETLIRRALACLTTFVSASWTTRKSAVSTSLGSRVLAERGVEVDLDAGLLGERLRQPLERGDEAEVVEHLRTQLDREAADVLEREDDVLPQLGACSLSGMPGERLLERLETEQDRGERLAGLVVKLARKAAALELLRLHDPAQRVARDAL